jgi:hypothetical protein
LTIPKVKKGEIWRDLLSASFKKPPTMKVSVWWEVKDAYSSAMNKFSEMLEEDDVSFSWLKFLGLGYVIGNL